MERLAHLTFDLVAEIGRLTDLPNIKARIDGIVRMWGYESFVVTRGGDWPSLTDQIAMDNWPAGWSRHYRDQGYGKYDRVAAYCRHADGPFNWFDVPKDFQDTSRGREVTAVARDHGLRSGRVVPIWGRGGYAGAVGFASKEFIFDAVVLRAIDVIGLLTHKRVTELTAVPDQSPPLTVGEREVLTWIAAGKSTWEISEILRISERAVEWRLQQSFLKLDAVSRTQAVVIAIKTGQISI